MHRRIILTVLLMGLLVFPAWPAEPPPFAALLAIPFDGSAEARAPGATLAVSGADNLKYAEGRLGRAADFRQGGCLEYRDLPPLNMQEGTLELWVRAAHDRRDLQDHYYLQMLNADGTSGLELKFYHVELSSQVTMWEGKRRHRRYGWGFATDQWFQLVVTWNSTDPDLSGLRLYFNAAEDGYPCAYQPIQPPQWLRLGCKSPEEGLPAAALLDGLAVYNRCLSAGQVKALYEAAEQPLEQKVALLRDRLAADEKLRAERHDRLFNQCKIGILHGRQTSLLNWPDAAFEPLRLPVPEPVHEDALAKTDLAQYAALFCPGGGGLHPTEPNKEALLKYVREGGGYVGVCGGAVTAIRCGLVEAEMYPFPVTGTVFTRLKPHPVTEGYNLNRQLLFPHAKGPLLVPRDPTDTVVATFSVGKEPLPTFVNVLARQYGEGRVLIFSGHPESSAETRALLRNAVMWAAKII